MVSSSSDFLARKTKMYLVTAALNAIHRTNTLEYDCYSVEFAIDIFY